MEIKIHKENPDYLIIEFHQIIHELSILQIEEMDGNKNNSELIKLLQEIISSIKEYEKNERDNGNLYKHINEVTIEKDSPIGKLILNKINNPEYICLNHLTHALLKSIDYEEWDYYDKLTILIKRLKHLNFKFDYKWFKATFGEDIATYITNSSYLYPTISRNTVYLYKDKKITQIKQQSKTRTKTK